MTNRDKINVIAANLSDMGKNSLANELIRMYDELISDAVKLHTKLDEGRDYLMRVQSDEITVQDSLEAFGFGSNGLSSF